jgi:gliding motility-associated lipoprotein GldD
MCDYIPLSNNLIEISESFRKMVYEHSFKSSAIIERLWINDSTEVYGLAYEIKGNTACNFAFTLTDSSNHFFSGQLMFQISPNYDSLKPSIKFIKEDIEAIIASFYWIN